MQESCSNRAKLVRVKLAGLQAEGAMFQAAFADAVGHMVKQTSEQPTQVPHKAFVLLPRRYPKSKSPPTASMQKCEPTTGCVTQIQPAKHRHLRLPETKAALEP